MPRTAREPPRRMHGRRAAFACLLGEDAFPDLAARASNNQPQIKMTRRFLRPTGLLVLALLGVPALARDEQVPPVPVSQAVPDYPYEMRRTGRGGLVLLSYVVTRDGRVANPFPILSSHPDFSVAVVDAVRRWRFRPGKINGRSVNTRIHQAFPFSLNEDGSLGGPEHPPELPEEYRWHEPPIPIRFGVPVYPFEDVQAGTKGRASINTIIGPHGRVEAVHVLEATTAAMGEALRAMVETWTFNPAKKRDGKPCRAVFGLTFDFNPDGVGGVPVSASALEILGLLRQRPDKIAGLRDLDGPPKPLHREAPIYPLALQSNGHAGEALIEFFIDEDGLVQLPRVVSATAPECGYSAVQAVSEWRFAPPLRNKKPAVVRARIPITFSLPDEDAPARDAATGGGR